MSYTALDLMREKNTHDFGRELGPFVPELPEAYKTGMDLKSVLPVGRLRNDEDAQAVMTGGGYGKTTDGK